MLKELIEHSFDHLRPGREKIGENSISETVLSIHCLTH